MINEITPLEVAARTAVDRPQLLDVREDSEVAICRIDGAFHLPLHRLMAGEVPPLDRDRDVVCYCHHGVRSFYSALQLLKLGFSRVYNMTGGIHAWAHHVDPSMPRY